MYENVDVSMLLGRTLTDVKNVDDEEIVFTTDSGERFRLWHSQDCCERVRVEDITGDLSDLVGAPLTMADESSSADRPADLATPEYEDESQTWTFYRFATVKGYVTIRWYGSSNGYYSESVSFDRVQ